jgi:GTP-binding protein
VPLVPKSPEQPDRPSDHLRRAEFVASAGTDKSFPPPTLAEIAFLGRSNVGKSSLMNVLLEQKSLVRTSGTPGCTRQVNWFLAEARDGAQLMLVDLPGYGYAQRSRHERNEWAALIENYLLTRASLRAAVIVLDVRRDPEEEERQLIELLNGPARASRPELQVTWVATKLDKLSRNSHKPRLAEISRFLGQPALGFSALSGDGRIPIWRRLRRAVGVSEPEVVGQTTTGDSG